MTSLFIISRRDNDRQVFKLTGMNKIIKQTPNGLKILFTTSRETLNRKQQRGIPNIKHETMKSISCMRLLRGRSCCRPTDDNKEVVPSPDVAAAMPTRISTSVPTAGLRRGWCFSRPVRNNLSASSSSTSVIHQQTKRSTLRAARLQSAMRWASQTQTS